MPRLRAFAPDVAAMVDGQRLSLEAVVLGEAAGLRAGDTPHRPRGHRGGVVEDPSGTPKNPEPNNSLHHPERFTVKLMGADGWPHRSTRAGARAHLRQGVEFLALVPRAFRSIPAWTR
jgi:hypothetical protein